MAEKLSLSSSLQIKLVQLSSVSMETTLKGAKSVAITLEQKHAPLQPKGEMVMRGESSL